MRNQIVLGVTFALSACLSAAAVAQKNKNPDIPVTTIVSDYDSGIAPALQIQSDQLGAYNNSSTLTSIISSNGIWYLDSLNPLNATRRVVLRFTNPIPGSGPNGGDPVAPASGSYRVFAYTNCTHANYQTSLLTLPAGQTMPCPMVVQFEADGRRYYLHMNDRGVDFPQTNHVNITCIFPASGTSPCSQWVIRPSRTDTLPDGTTIQHNIANLSYQVNVKGKLTYVKQGDFYVSFSIIVTNP